MRAQQRFFLLHRGGSHFRSSRSYKHVGDGWNDKASKAVCECPGLPNF
jgi:hypothetical protein